MDNLYTTTCSGSNLDISDYTITLDSTGGFNGINNYSFTGTNNSGHMSITGEDADITLNGKSMKGWMEKVEERLAILEPNEKLESEWAELKELGERYRELEKQILEKAKVWDILKK